jgi:hypothetical protein
MPEDDGAPRARAFVCIACSERRVRTSPCTPRHHRRRRRIFRPVDDITAASVHVRAEFESGRTRRLVLLAPTTHSPFVDAHSPRWAVATKVYGKSLSRAAPYSAQVEEGRRDLQRREHKLASLDRVLAFATHLHQPDGHQGAPAGRPAGGQRGPSIHSILLCALASHSASRSDSDLHLQNNASN